MSSKQTKTDSHSSFPSSSLSQGSPALAGKKSFPAWGIVVILFAVLAAGLFLFNGSAVITGFVSGTSALPPTNGIVDNTTNSLNESPLSTYDELSPGAKGEALKGQLSKAKYQRAVFEVDRSKYHLFQKAAEFRNETLEQTKAFFYNCCSLVSEEQIFGQLPSFPSDFADVAFAMQTGRLFQIGLLGEQYYKQPEFWGHGEETAVVNQFFMFRGWSQPDLKYWGEYGLQVMPSDQSTDVSKRGQNTFTAVVFAGNGWNIQNYLGINLIPDSNSTNYFDISISEDNTGKPYFLLGPTFPLFDKDWSTKVTIKGTVKPGTPNGAYQIRINPIAPPRELNEKWSSEHTGIYTPYGAIGPSGGYITLNIGVSD